MVVTQLQFDIFVASKIGSFKHVRFNTDIKKNTKKSIENLQDLSELKEDDSVSCLSWADGNQTEILIGRKNQRVQLYDTVQSLYTKEFTADYNKGPIKGLCKVGDSIVTALESGVVKIWREPDDKSQTIDTGGGIDKMRHSPFDASVIATGGKENDIRLWDLSENKMIFQAKNVKNDWLQLRVPVWISDVCFLPESEGKVLASCTRHGFIRLYDTRAQRRPVCTVEFKELPATCMAASHLERHVVVGFGRGQINQVDFRGKGKPDKGYKGCVGAVTDLFTLSEGPFLVSTSLDRHMRVHDANTKKMLHKQYLTSKLTCLLVQTQASTPLKVELVKEETEPDENIVISEVGSDDEYEALFDNMERISDKPNKKQEKRLREATATDGTSAKATSKKRKSAMSPSAASEEPASLDDSIKRLLRSTEKTKRRLVKEKKKKKARSVFHNV